MKLSRTERQLLLAYQGFQTSPPNLLRVLRKLWRTWLLLIVYVALCCFLICYLMPRFAYLGLLPAGLVFGAILRDLGISLRLIRVWPVLTQIIEWNRVHALLQADGLPADQENHLLKSNLEKGDG
jgi:asparagine N-glycosylation enzyme membrane subunit Stt3